MDKFNEYLDFAKDIAKHAGMLMLKYFNENNGEKYKEDNTIVTLADTEINDFLIKQVKEKYPSHSVDGEEKQFGDSNYKWVCDPVDGTAMYAKHIPTAVFSLVLAIDGIPTVGVIYDPFTDSMYSAIKGQGAFINENKISVNDYELGNYKTEGHYDTWPTAEYDTFNVYRELSKSTRFTNIGSIAHAGALVAKGDYILAIFVGTEHKNCDIAAVKIIVEEAGGKVTDLFGNEQRYDGNIKGALISNGKIHDEVVSVIKKYLDE